MAKIKEASPATRVDAVVIKPLEWGGREDEFGDVFLCASTPFGTYRVEKDAGCFKWGYCFDEQYDEDSFSCDSIEDGKAMAWKHWTERLSEALQRLC